MRKTILRPFLLTLLLSVSGLHFSQIPQGAINGLFSVSDNQQVLFSQGNLQYIGSASTPYWKFAESQWEYFGNNGQGSTNHNVDRDLFGWGTSGYNHGAVCYQPWSTIETNSKYYAYGGANYNLYDQSGQADWGYNAILNGGNQENSGWRTLTKDEWLYVFDTRTTASGIRYAKAKVNNVNGVILLPDNWSTSYYSLSNTNQYNASFDSNTISASQWSTLEQHGAVFLPAAHYRGGALVYNYIVVGYYWSASYNDGDLAYNVYFNDSYLRPQNSSYRGGGLSVRLVRSAQSCSINASPSPAAGGAVSGGGTYPEGADCTLTATANTGYTFVNWTENGAVVSTSATYTFTVNGNRTLVANFGSGFSHPGGVLNGVFKVSNSSWVFFSQGNLQYIGSASTPYWKFAEHQWEYFGTTTGQNSTKQIVARDLFGWGTSGYNHGAVCYQPWSTTQTNSKYYAYGGANYNLYDQSGQADWGYNAILNGGNQENSGWRTLTKDEWLYVFDTRTTASGIRYAKANVNEVNGVILLPDDWSTSYYSLNNTNQSTASFDSNTISASQWSTLEQHGAVFLPAAGYRQGAPVYSVGSDGYYWSASYYNEGFVYDVWFGSSFFSLQGDSYRFTGHSVRLVRSAQNYSINASPSPAAGGAVSGGGTYPEGADCTLTATANTGYTFVNWTENGTVVSTNATYTFTVNGDRTLVANFSLNSYQITATVNPSAGGTVTGAGAYNHGSTATLTATANTGYTFVNWTENGTPVSTNTTYSFTVTGNRNLVANFTGNNAHPGGVLNGVFKVSNSSWVFFSQGNLQYIGSAATPYWKFAELQWECLGTTTGQNSAGQNVARDLFGWGTSGYNHGAVCYQPWSTTQTNSDYYAYGGANYNLYDQSGQADWGYNAILNGGNQENSGWRTLSPSEWWYVFYFRTTASGIRYARANVNEVNGVILLPDDWSTSYYSLNNTNQGNANYESNVISASQWSTLEQHGAVFLPAAGCRNGTSVYNAGSTGYYWSASYINELNAYCVWFNSSNLDPEYNGSRYRGQSVRLVRSAQNYSINAIPSPTAGGAVSGGGAYPEGADCTLTATANTGYTFVNWTENGTVVSTNATYTFTVNGDRTLVANFGSGSSHPGGVLNGVFKVSNSSWVFFSQGNLQYIGSAATPYWKFAELQWEYLGTTTGQDSTNQNVDRDLFGWGTSGYNHGAVCYQPWSTSSTYSDYYAYGEAGYNLYDQSGQADWGYNAILNGGNQENSGWRTLTKDEWLYVFNTRTTASGIRYAKAKVNDVKGVILLPDDWSTSYYSLNNTNQSTASFDSNTISASQWSTLEQHGAVFLPAAGYRLGASVCCVGSYGFYWSASYYNSGAYSVLFNDSYLYPQDYPSRYYGLSVRLVRSAQNYSINAIPSPTAGGAVSGGGTYPEGADCTLTATANTGYTFVNWTENGTVVSTSTTYTFTVNGDRTLVANFSLNSYQVTVSANPSAGGTAAGGGTFNYGATATVTASANTGYTFVNWTENGNPVSTSATYTFTVNADRTLVANFSLNSYQVTVSTNPSAGGTAAGGGTFNYGETATVTATANTGYQFINWTQNGTQVSASATYSFTVAGNADLVANFGTEGYLVTAVANPAEGGVVTGSSTYTYGSTAVLTATANMGYTFVNWTENGTQVSTNASYSFTVTGNRNLVANFSVNSYQVTVSANPSAGGTVTGAGTYNYGETATVTASANTGYQFINWTQNGTQVSTNATYSFTVAGNANLVANFVQSTYQITAVANPENSGTILGAGTYSYGVTAALTVIPKSGFMFINWTKDGIIVSTETTYSFTVTESAHYVANLYNITGVDELSAEDFTLYPNPADNILVIEGPSEINSCEIYNLAGQLVYKEMDCQQKMEINTSRLPVGAYLVKLVSDGKVFTRKFVKK